MIASLAFVASIALAASAVPAEKKPAPTPRSTPNPKGVGPVLGLSGTTLPAAGTEPTPPTESTAPPPRDDPESPPDGLKNAKALRISGIALMIAGGAAALAGAGVLTAFTLQHNDFDDKLTKDLAEQDERGCPLGSNTGRCGELERNIDQWRQGKVDADRGKLIGTVTLGLGAAVLVAGGVMYAFGKHFRRTPKTARVYITPTGFGVAGRF